MSIIDDILALIAPHECLRCGSEGSLLCGDCDLTLPIVPMRCYRCRKVSEWSIVCKKCRSSSRLSSVVVTNVYQGAVKELVWQLKFAGAIAATVPMARRMLPILARFSDAIIVPAPTASRRVRQRGYDQAVLLARRLARRSGMRYENILRRVSQTHQVGSSRSQRLRQQKGAFRVTRSSRISGAHIILIDDVITTGATLEAAAACLRAAGASRVDAIVYAQP